MGHSKVILGFVSLVYLFHSIQCMSPSYTTRSADGVKWRQSVLGVLAQDVINHQDRSNSEGSGESLDSMLHLMRTSILKELGTQSEDWQTIKSSAFGKSRLAPFSLGSEKTFTSFKEDQRTVEDYDGELSQNPVNIIIVTSKTTAYPEPSETCSSGLGPCFSSSSLNGTNLVWNDMKRTLSFAWELHVFGSASLLLLLALLGILGVIQACTLSFPLREALTLTNSLVVISAIIRAVLFLLDPYGTRQLLSRALFTALYNVSLHLLLWAQTSLSLLTLRGLTLLFFHLDVHHLWVVGALAVAHCIPLVVADLYPSLIYHALPLLLQTLSLCWGIPLALGIVMKSCVHLQQFSRPCQPKWMPSHRVEMCAKRVTAVCGILGILSCTLHLYSLLWLYGLLGDWRHFRWGWWLCQFWGRIFELSWGFSIITLGSWISCTSSRGTSKHEHSQSKDTNMVDKILPSLRHGSLRKSEKSWEELMPNNWSKYKLSRPRVGSGALYDDQLDYSDPVSTTSCDSQAAVLWQKVGERECVLSLIEFDMMPPSPINLRRSIDNALHHGPIMPSGLFIAPPPSWTQAVTGTDNIDRDDILPPAYSSFDWTTERESFNASQTSEPPWFASGPNNMPKCDSYDDITNL